MSQARLPEAEAQVAKQILGELDDVRVEIEVGTRALHPGRDGQEDHYSFRCRFKVSNCGAQPVRLMARRWRLCDAYHHLKELHGPCIPGQQPVIQPGANYSFQVTLALATEWGDFSGSLHFECHDGRSHEIAFEQQMLVPRPGMAVREPQMSPSNL